MVWPPSWKMAENTILAITLERLIRFKPNLVCVLTLSSRRFLTSWSSEVTWFGRHLGKWPKTVSWLLTWEGQIRFKPNLARIVLFQVPDSCDSCGGQTLVVPGGRFKAYRLSSFFLFVCGNKFSVRDNFWRTHPIKTKLGRCVTVMNPYAAFENGHCRSHGLAAILENGGRQFLAQAITLQVSNRLEPNWTHFLIYQVPDS